jgi:hypothetical protein
MKFTRTTPPPSVAQLHASVSSTKAEIAALEAEERDCNAALPDLVGDPAYAEIEARLRELRFAIPSKHDVLKGLEAGIPAAVRRECLADYVSAHADQERRTAKLARKAAKLYPELAGPLADLLHEMEANEREWDMLRLEARDLGVQGGIGHSAEVRVRMDLPGARQLGIFKSVLRETQLPNWNGGRPLFDAGLTNRR